MTPCIWHIFCLRNSSSVPYFRQPPNLPTALRRNRKCTECGTNAFGRNRMSTESAHLSTFGAETETEIRLTSNLWQVSLSTFERLRSKFHTENLTLAILSTWNFYWFLAFNHTYNALICCVCSARGVRLCVIGLSLWHVVCSFFGIFSFVCVKNHCWWTKHFSVLHTYIHLFESDHKIHVKNIKRQTDRIIYNTEKHKN